MVDSYFLTFSSFCRRMSTSSLSDLASSANAVNESVCKEQSNKTECREQISQVLYYTHIKKLKIHQHGYARVFFQLHYLYISPTLIIFLPTSNILCLAQAYMFMELEILVLKLLTRHYSADYQQGKYRYLTCNNLIWEYKSLLLLQV